MAKKKWGDPAEGNPYGSWADGYSDYDPEDTWIHRLYVILETLSIIVIICLAVWFLTSL